MAHSKVVLAGLSTTLLLALACDRPSAGEPSTAPQGVTMPQPPAQGIDSAQAPLATAGAPPGAASPTFDVSALDDPGIAGVLQSMHQRFVQQAGAAEPGVTDPAVRRAAHDSKQLHTDALTTDAALFKRLSLTPRQSSVSKQIDDEARSTLSAISSDRGPAYDRDFVRWQMDALTDALQLCDRMSPIVKDLDLAAEIGRERATLSNNLKTFTDLQKALAPGVANQQPMEPTLPRRMR